jgi:hypothetical protein
MGAKKETIEKIALKKLDPKASNLRQTIQFGEDCYDSGVLEVLKGIASQEVIHADPEQSDLATSVGETFEEKSEELKAMLDKKALKLFEEYEAASAHLMAVETNDNFIAGFIRGYMYLKKINETQY